VTRAQAAIALPLGVGSGTGVTLDIPGAPAMEEKRARGNVS
jgi:hypothetical protein